ncbi:MAG: terminase small subunit [Nitrococcus sp.]|nr:terminase small subunit [Nitrococcus sp.]
MAGKLTPKQERFCREYILDLNATQAARRAGYSERTAHVQAHDLLKKPKIANRVIELQAARNAATNITAEQTITDIRELADMALGRVAYPKTIVVDGEAQVVMVRNVSFAGAARALELLGRHQGIFNDKLHVQHSTLADVLESLSDIPSSTPAGRIKAREKKDEPTQH